MHNQKLYTLQSTYINDLIIMGMMYSQLQETTFPVFGFK